MMKKALFPAICLVFLVPAAQADDQDKPVVLSSRIADVTVYSDKARIAREASVDLKAGSAVYSLSKLPGWVDEGSVRVALSPANAGRIGDVQVRREYLAKTTDQDLHKAEAAVQEMADKMGELTDELKVLDEQARQIEATRAFSLEKLPKDTAVREINVDGYAKVVDYISDSLRKIAASRRAVNTRVRALQPEMNALRKKLNEIQQMKQLEQCEVAVTIEAGAAQKAALSVTYMLPGATWEPAHEVRAEGADPKKVKLTSYAEVTQTTGEEWSGATLSFSTQSSTETIRIPEIDSLLLGSSRAVAQIAGNRSATFVVAQQKFAEQNPAWNTKNWVDPNDMPDFRGNNMRMAGVQNRTTTLFSRLQTRGTTAHFAGTGKPTIRFDGRPVRVPIGETELDAARQIVAAPEVSLNAVRTLKLTNTGKQPFLPGQVALHHEGAFLGTTDLEFVAPGESFAVFLGVADHVKLGRVMDRRRSSLVRGKRTRMQIAFDVSAENLSDTEVALTLTDRIPVSEDKEIRVFDVEIGQDLEADSKGLVKWELTLKPKEKQTLRLEYTIEYPPVLLQEMSKSQPGAPEASDSIHYKIQALESTF